MRQSRRGTEAWIRGRSRPWRELAPTPVGPRAWSLGLLLAFVLGASGCGDSPLSTRYAAERDLWTARRVERSLQAQPELTEESLARARGAYEKVLDRYELASVEADTLELRNLARIRASAILGLGRVLRAGGNLEEAAGLLSRHRLEAPWDLEVTLRLHRDLVEVLSVQADADSMVAVLRSMVEVLPPATPDGDPIPVVLEAPLREVDLLQAVGREAEAETRLGDAETYYRRLVETGSGRPLEVAALLQLANVQVKQQRFEDADATLSRAVALPAAEAFETRILASRASVRQQGLGDHAGAVRILGRIVENYPDDPRAPGALLQMGVAYSANGQPDSALIAFERVEEQFPGEIDVASQARFLSANVLERTGRSDEAVRRYREVVSRYPRSSSALLAPLQLASYYESAGQEDAMHAVLREAAAEYQRLARSLSDDPASRDLVLSALDQLADVYARLGEWEDAVEALLTRAEGYPRDYRSPLAYVRAAAIQEDQLQNPTAAIHTLEKLTQRYPDLPLSLRAQSKIDRLRDPS